MSESSFLFADKPAGVTTHTSLNKPDLSNPLHDKNDGFCESLSSRAGFPLFVVHRLDRETTGAICFAKDPDTAAKISSLFATRDVQKRYLFLSDRAPKSDEFRVESFIERSKNSYVSFDSTSGRLPNARTQLRRLSEKNGLSLWEAMPETGKPHQIRLHAQDCGIPVLGDLEHGGSPFPALCLHSESIQFELDGVETQYSSPPPRWFLKSELIQDQLLCRWLAGADRRERLLRSWEAIGENTGSRSRTLRWLHSDGDPLRADQLADVYSLSWFDDQPSEKEWRSIHQWTEELGWKNWYLQVRGNRGRAPNEESVFPGPHAFPPRWIAEENGLKYEFRVDSGLSPGLFLDQRRNRHWVKKNSASKSVLNLFCYTGGFSVCAAAGGASKVTSVDVSRTFLEWARRNFELNELDVGPHEFRSMDSREYLAWAAKKNLEFDIVICDPPSFGRSKSGVFKFEKDFSSLLVSLVSVTRPNGYVLFSTNFEKWNMNELFARTMAALKPLKQSLQLHPTPSADWDFELPRSESNMKSFLIERLR